jgi:putative transposase
MVRWLVRFTPRHFGFFRARWSCALLGLLLWEQHRLRKNPATMRRGLHRMAFVRRRPRPVVGPRDPVHAANLQRIRRLLEAVPADEAAVFQDKVDVYLNPKVGACWMRRGQQAEVATPGSNEKRHLAGWLHWRTRRLHPRKRAETNGLLKRANCQPSIRRSCPNLAWNVCHR